MPEPLNCPSCQTSLREHLAPKAVAASLGVTEWTVRRMIYLKQIAGLKIRHQWRICPPSVREYIASCAERATA